MHKAHAHIHAAHMHTRTQKHAHWYQTHTPIRAHMDAHNDTYMHTDAHTQIHTKACTQTRLHMGTLGCTRTHSSCHPNPLLGVPGIRVTHACGYLCRSNPSVWDSEPLRDAQPTSPGSMEQMDLPRSASPPFPAPQPPWEAAGWACQGLHIPVKSLLHISAITTC